MSWLSWHWLLHPTPWLFIALFASSFIGFVVAILLWAYCGGLDEPERYPWEDEGV